MFAVTITLVVIILIISLVSLATPNWTIKNATATPGISGPAPTGIFRDTKIGLWQACDKKCVSIDGNIFS